MAMIFILKHVESVTSHEHENPFCEG